jgi:hypothetical protein
LEAHVPPAEQVGPYTTKLAKLLGQTFPNTSPQRVDAAINAYMGGAADDFLQLVGLGSTSKSREFEASDFPVLGTLFQRGGYFNAQDDRIEKFYDDYGKLESRVEGQRFPVKQQLPPMPGVRMALPKTPDGVRLQIAQRMLDYEIKPLLFTASHAYGTKEREQLYRQAGEAAAQASELMAPSFTSETDKADNMKALVSPQTGNGRSAIHGN